MSAQLENGFTRIANEILDELAKAKLNATQMKIILCCIRYTYGFSRKSHELSLTFITSYTGVSKRYVSAELNKLIKSKILLVKKQHSSSGSGRVLMFNKNYKQWDFKGAVNNSSTGEESFNTGDEQYFTAGDEQLFNTGGEQLFTQERKNKEKYKEIEKFFDYCWNLYPNQEGKSEITYEQKEKLYYEVGEERLKKAVEKYSKKVKGREKRYIKRGKTFFNYAYEDYLEDISEVKSMRKGKVIELTADEYEQYVNKLSEKVK